MRKDVTIRKEYVLQSKGIRDEKIKNPPKIWFVIRTDLYDSGLQYFLDLLEIAKQDFPDLELDKNDVKALQFGGDRIKGLRGLEFEYPMPCKIPEGYVDGHFLDPTM